MSENQIVKDFEMNGMRVEVKVSYNIGGMNWASSNTEPRGYYVHVQPYEVEHHGTYSMRKMVGFSGIKSLLLEVNRKSAKQLQKAVEMVDDAKIEGLLTYCKFN